MIMSVWVIMTVSVPVVPVSIIPALVAIMVPPTVIFSTTTTVMVGTEMTTVVTALVALSRHAIPTVMGSVVLAAAVTTRVAVSIGHDVWMWQVWI